MSDIQNTAVTQDRSPKYPRLTLEDSVSKTASIYKEAGKAGIIADTIAKVLGYTNASNGGAQASMSALGQYGLLAKGADKKFSVTPLAIKILHPINDAQRLQALKEAALGPKIFVDIQKEYHACSESVLTSHLVQLGFTPDGAAKASATYKANSLFAKLDSADYGVPEQPKEESPLEKPKVFSMEGAPQSLKDAHDSLFGKEKGKQVLAQYSIPLGANEATLVFTGEKLTLADFDDLADFVQMFKKQYERKIKSEEHANVVSNIMAISKSDKTEERS